MSKLVFAARIAVVGLTLLASLASAAIADPQQMVRETGDRVLAELTQRKAELEADPRLIYPMVERTVLPHFDFRSMSQSAMGRFWRDANEAQKDDITLQFRELLVRTYATALLGYSGQQIEYLPVNYRAGETKVMIPTRIASNSAPTIPINYRLRLDDANKWLIYDIVVDNVSLITNYRSQFAAAIRRQGIDGLIDTLADKNRQSVQ
jgi:phospholipid transport system substrate-binding protein